MSPRFVELDGGAGRPNNYWETLMECGHIDLTTQRRCTRSAGHPGGHVDVPGGSEW